MKTISLGSYGVLRFAKDHWACRDAPTAIGAVDIDYDFAGDLPVGVANSMIAALDQIDEIHALAEEYLQQHAPEDFARAQPLQQPSLIFRPETAEGAFTIFYSGAEEEDETCYGVEFRGFAPCDLVIGD